MNNISDRFNIGKKLGQGTFSYIYEAFDKTLKQNVALKIEKKDKNKNILIFEFSVLNMLKGNNLAKVRKCLDENYSLKIAIQLLVTIQNSSYFSQIEMLDAIEEVHDRGFIHRDVKASNFVLSRDNKHVYIVDFGLAKKHLDDNKVPMPQRRKADFRGTVSFASLNAHNNIDLSRRDDLWSLYFVILDFLNEKLKWREQKEYSMEEVKNIKTECLNNPEEKLWIATKDCPEVKNIFYHLKDLSYKDIPDYKFIRNQLKNILERNTEIPSNYISQVATQAFINAQRVNGGAISQIYLQQQQQPPFTVYHGHQYAKALQYSQNNAANTNNQQQQQQQSHQNQIQEFQTPERPQNHHRISHINAASMMQQQHLITPLTPQNNQSILDDGAFPKASPHHLVNGTLNQNGQVIQGCNLQNNLTQQFFTTSVQQRKTDCISQPQDQQNGLRINQIQMNNNVAQPVDIGKRAALKRKQVDQLIEQVVRHEQLQAQEGDQLGNNQIQGGNMIDQNNNKNGPTSQAQVRRTKQVTKQEKKVTAGVQVVATQANGRKRDVKKQHQIKIIPDEEPIQIKTILDNAQNELINNTQGGNQNGQIKSSTNLNLPNNMPIFQFSPQNASNVNQQISISQNFYLSPQFLLLLGDQEANTNQLLQQATVAAQPNGQTYPLTTTLQSTASQTAGIMSSRGPTTHITSSQIPGFNPNNPELLHHPSMIPLNLNPQGNLFNKIQTTSQTFTTQQQINQDAQINYAAQYKKTNQSLETMNDGKVKEDQQFIEKNYLIQSIPQPQIQSQQIVKFKGNIPQKSTFYDMLSQNSANTKGYRSSQTKKQQSSILNGYYYDPILIEKQNLPCFKVEKITRSLPKQLRAYQSETLMQGNQNFAGVTLNKQSSLMNGQFIGQQDEMLQLKHLLSQSEAMNTGVQIDLQQQ
ncbi:serine threonine protein kinase [Stylonychia lemnae]|uniref:Casein kinase I n=1 Tax=Stylonychia lemnae TaxID=5949 RepID=A0A078ALY2_STYLE|nr:serine threonine protein kinase [Stylonychia lemnae]|eukprot:CDW83244.1 serine threonine protein kinase [Stylonychia lemnae]